MPHIKYNLGRVKDLKKLFPPAKFTNELVENFKGEKVKLSSRCDVIKQYTENSLQADAFGDISVDVTKTDGHFYIHIDTSSDEARLKSFAKRHTFLFSAQAGGKAVIGMDMMKELNVWNPMAGYHVNGSPSDGLCKWNLFPPLGLNVVGQKGVLLLHYPPWQVLQQATFLQVMTMHRWTAVLTAAGVPENEVSFYRTYVDVNPIAAPGSGQSEYPNDYFPIMMASAFFDGPSDEGVKSRDYIKTMLETYLQPPEAKGTEYTLPLLICGSPLYDPQAPGWFKAAYTETLPQNENGEPLVDVLQVGEFKIRKDSKRKTPYLIGNHMIAAGVAGKCTGDASKKPDIRKYEAQDLVAASFLYEYRKNPDISPQDAKEKACMRWFGNKDGSGAPCPPEAKDKQIICALAQMDLFFVGKPSPHSLYTFEEAMQRCADAKNDCNPCCSPIEPAEYKFSQDFDPKIDCKCSEK